MMRTETMVGSSITVLSEDGGKRPRQPLRARERDLRLSLVRNPTALPWRSSSSSLDELTLHEILASVRAVSAQPGGLLIGGSDPLQRTDIWELLTELATLRPENLGVCTSGHGLDDTVVHRLRSVGVHRVHVPFHCARQDAHDWLVGRSGALKTAHRAIRACLGSDLRVVADIVLTRPTMPHLAETVEVLARTGVRTLCVRRLTEADADGLTFVPLAPRLSLLEDALVQAAAVALRHRVRLVLRDLPLCTAPRLRPLFAMPPSEVWVMPDGTVQPRTEPGVGCATCPGLPRCAGAPRDYVTRFGWEEFVDPVVAAPRIHESVRDQQTQPASQPMSFTWPGPRRVTCEVCADAEDEASTPQSLQESTRFIRARLVEAARYRPSVLRLVGADLLAHPQAALLIYDALRLFRCVEVAGEASPVSEWSDLDWRRLKDLPRLDVALYGPDAATHDGHCGVPGAFAAMRRGVETMRTKTTITVGGYAILHDARTVPAFAEAWERGLLPGEPRFRLSARGGSLDELVACARELPPGKARSALLAVLPPCLCEGVSVAGNGDQATAPVHDQPQQWIHWGRSTPYQPCGSDPTGAFEACHEARDSCAHSGCRGTAVGWHRRTRSEQWTASI